MKIYVAEINGEAIMAFPAEDDGSAFGIVNEKNGDFQLGLSDVVRANNGKPLWDGESTISPRLATAAEHDQWFKALNADDLNVYLIPVVDPNDDDEEEDDEEEDDDGENDDDAEIHLLSEETVKEIRVSLDTAEKILYGYLDKSFGSYKKAPDDHPVFGALQSIKDVADHFSEEEEDIDAG
jgi:hypothetical protein